MKIVHSEVESDHEDDQSKEDDMNSIDSQDLDGEQSAEGSESEEDENQSNMSDEEQVPSDELEDNATYQDWYDQAMQATETMREEKYEKYINEGMENEQAKEKAFIKTSWAAKRVFFKQFGVFLWNYIQLTDDDTYQEMIDDIEEKINKDIDISKAIKGVIVKHKSKFDGLFQYDDEQEEEMESSDISDE